MNDCQPGGQCPLSDDPPPGPPRSLPWRRLQDFIGTVWDRKYGVDCPAHFMNLLRPHASTVGNHEFDWGADKAADYLRRLSFPNLVSAALCPPVQPSMLRSRKLAGPQSSQPSMVQQPTTSALMAHAQCSVWPASALSRPAHSQACCAGRPASCQGTHSNTAHHARPLNPPCRPATSSSTATG